MEKIPTALVRDPNNRAKVLPEITPGCEWVFEGEGVPTRKYDGTCVMLDENGKWWARREVKKDGKRPEGFVMVTFDIVTDKMQGWEPVEQSSFAKFHAEALTYRISEFKPGTYELVGPKINGNPENFDRHSLLRHAIAPIIQIMRGRSWPELVIEELKEICDRDGIEGVVWHHPDGRMAKLKGRDL